MTDTTERPDLDLLSLHALRCTGLAPLERVAEFAEADESAIGERLRALAAAGSVVEREGAIAGWMLTPEGRSHHEALLADQLDAAGGRDAVADAYRRFLVLNEPLLAICSAWQVREEDGEQVPNDHTDADYDAAIVDRLEALHRGVSPVLADLEAALPRFGAYASRFEAALAKLRDDEQQWLTSVRCDSYHTVWFQLHEDLLATLGISREEEAGTGA
ncbi:MAG: transcriptional regulator [Actinobacteria bacterium]|nr:transcriptional regulator [Actinomycetota bacterium]